LPEIVSGWLEVLIGNGGDYSCICEEFVAGIRANTGEADSESKSRRRVES
jgi:hypothetical protein